MEKTIKRTTTQQFEKLVELMQNNPDVAKGMGNFGSSKKSRAELWEKFAAELNAIGPPMRNGREWNKVWLDYKQKLKKQISTNRRETVATGGGPYVQQSLTPLEQTVDELLHLQEAVNPSGSTFGANIQETEGNDRNDSSQPEAQDEEMDLSATSTQARRRMTVEDRENIRLSALERQSEVQEVLCSRVSGIEKRLEEISRYARKTYEIKKEKLNLLKMKEQRKKEENLEKNRQHKEKMEMKLKELELKTLKYSK
ncbi:PREDICTED: uncharacterized protein LOC108365647 [Rhagoletis zephyria]|uniref:uncharacterized protein LOC108365647 n=1 Tax=Rhagoletis zephyria TaxID=28612 RepID=UPI00081163F5|nr:PREDICTED: uncharacterized protein LOC108365647 [Rhagoletis zephyria]